MSKEELHLKRWFKFSRTHKTIPPVGLVKDQANVIDSLSYAVFVRQVTNIPNKNKANLCIRLLINLFNMETKEFFGRTYESPFIDLQYDDENGQTYSHDPVIAYFHLKHSISPPVQIVFEVVQFEKKDGIMISPTILGWGMNPLQIGQAQKMTLKRGSSRFLISQQANFDGTLYNLICDIEENEDFSKVKVLIPEACVCGIGDEILGLRGMTLLQMQLVPEQVAFVSSLKVVVPIQVDLIISENLKKFKEVKYRDESHADLHIVSKRLIAAFHNGWNFTNSKGLNNFVTLEDGQVVQWPFENQKIDCKVLEFRGALDVNHIYNQPNIGVFVFQLEYDSIQYLKLQSRKQRTTVICGWVPVISASDFEEELITGPGSSLNNKVLIDLSDVHCPLTLTGKINFGGIGVAAPGQFHPSEQSESMLNNLAPQSLAQIRQGQAEEGEKKGDFMDDKTKLKVLENTLRQLQQERQLSSTQVAMDFENKLKMDRQKEQEYQRMVEQIKKQHEEEIMRITQQYEELKRMMSDINQTQQQYLIKAQPTAALAMIQQSVLYDQQELEKWKIIESMTSVPRKTFIRSQDQLLIEAKYGSKNLSREDIVFLTRNGVRELFSQYVETTDNDDLKLRSLQYELQDKRQHSTILIQFLCFRPKITQESENLEPFQNFYSEEGRIPQRVEFTINFFDFPLYTTEPLLFENGFDKNSFQSCLRQNIPFLFIREHFLKTGESHKEPVFKFEVSSVEMGYPNAYGHYCKYLYNKNLTVEMWDSDAKMLFGTFKIPMRSLMRQGQDTAYIMKKVDIVATEFKRLKGEIHVLIKNIGKEDKILETTDQFNKTKRKVISTKTLNARSLVGQKEEEVTLIQQDPDERIKERIRRFKNESIKPVSLAEINRFKEVKKNAFVRSVIQDHLSDEKVIYPIYGKLEIVPLEFRNPFSTGQNFIIVVDDQEIQCSGLLEMQIVHQATEWKYFVDTENYPKPPEYNMIQYNQAAMQYAFFLNSKETVTLLIKYITFREVDTSYTELQKTEDLSLQKGKQYLLKYSYPRQVAVYVNTNEGQTVGGLRIKMYPKPNSIDHIYRFYERDKRQVSVVFPAIFGYSVPAPEKRPKLYATDRDVMVEWANDFELRISLRMPEVNKDVEFNVLCYQDTYMREQLANWQIVLYSLGGMGLEVPLGQVQTAKLTVNVGVTRQVRFFSSHPLCVWFPQPYDGIVSLQQGQMNMISISVRIFVERIYKVLVTCVDVDSKDLVKSWIIQIAPTVPPVSQVFDVTCPRDSERNVVVPYQNKMNTEIWLTFVTSNPAIIQVMEKRIQFKPQQTIELNMRISRVGEMQTAEVKVFVGDDDRSKDTYDCLLFRIVYQ